MSTRIIEMVGLPGAGKSTCQTQIAEAYRSREVTLRGDLERQPTVGFGEYLRFAARHPRVTFWFLVGVVLNLNFSPRLSKRFLDAVGTTIGNYVKMARSFDSDRLFIMDEGLWQRSLSIFCYNERWYNPFFLRMMARGIAGDFPFIAVIHVDAGIDTALARCEQREGGLPYRFQHLSGDELRRKFSRWDAGITCLRQECPAGNWKTAD